MALDCDQILSAPPRVNLQTYSFKDTILYALGVGAGASELNLVYEQDLRALPTMAVVLGSPGFWLQDPRWGLDWKRILHGEQKLALHRSLPTQGSVRSELVVDQIYDKGADKGAVLYSTRKLFDEATGDLLATMQQSSFLRGNGGQGGSTERPPAAAPTSEGEPDETITVATRPDQALIYRLSGDFNPLHADPAVGLSTGFPGTVLHGLCTYGMAGRVLDAVIRTRGGGGLTRLDARFSSPVFPGELLQVDIWWRAESAAFRVRVVERDKIVLSNGLAEWSER